MRSTRLNRRAISAIAIAASATAMSQKTHAGATLTLFYGQEGSYANSNNGVFIGSTFNRVSVSTNNQGQSQNLAGSVTAQPITSSTPTTIMVPVGDFLSIGIDAVVTGNANPYAGADQGGFAQPSFLGLSELGIGISSSDTTGSFLTPVSSSKAGHPDTTILGVPSYNSTASINQLLPANGGTSAGPVPVWNAIHDGGKVQPNLPGYDSPPQSEGGLATGPLNTLGAFPAAGNLPPLFGNSPASIAELTQFGAQNNIPSYSDATDFVDNIIFESLQPGIVTLTPFGIASSTTYWTAPPGQLSSGPSASPIHYTTTTFNSGDIVTPLPSLVIEIGVGVPEPATTGLLAIASLGLLARRRQSESPANNSDI